ncbi:hypothetical protein GGI09_007576 [Coemansia sp. S100]|nr:hypothetical protein LPJ71_007061 [Coemansia sp. S17]KAJ2081749.1 hypothetical protein GGI09_007576 [Coemansia sp. S100]KAJ2095476.1 hypothetical protein GGI16_005193 [Coemansia sp. S142-1]
MTKKKRTVAVLSEEKFTAGIDAIIQRDYFPRTLDGEQQRRQGAQSARQSSGTLEEYLRTHTSEDNASFRRMVDSGKRRRDERYSRVFGSGQRSHSRSGFLLEPPSAAAAAECVRGSSRGIVHKNTRLPTQSSGLSLEEDDDDDRDDEESVAGTPVIDGYRLLRDAGDSGGSGFRLAAPSPRELAALRLGKRPTQASVVRASNGRSPLSPAAHRLLLLQSGRRGLTTPRSGSDLDLRRAYNSPR